MQGISVRLTGEGHIKCNGIQCIYDWLTGGSICLLYTCIVLDLIVGVTVCKTSVLNWLGRATWNIMVLNASMLDWLGGPSAFYIYIVLGLAMELAACKSSMLDWLGGHLPSIYMHCTRSNSGCNSMQDICALFTGEHLCWNALCHANIFGVAVFNASMLDWIGGPSASYIHALF